MSRTPKFAEALRRSIEQFRPSQQKCGLCGLAFNISQEDIDWFARLEVPVSLVCVDCKRARRLAFLNFTSFYRPECGVPGHSEKLISSIPPDSKYLIYDYEYWWGDAWDPLMYQKSTDPHASFLKQFQDLVYAVPQPEVTRDPSNVDSPYSLYGKALKNCYLTAGGAHSERVHYSTWPARMRDGLDVLIVGDSELCSNSVFSRHCYRSNFCYFSNDCMDSNFLYDCRNCQNCFASVNLRNKQYYFFNQPCTKEEYFKLRRAVRLGKQSVFLDWQKKFWELVKASPIRAVRIEHSDRVSGNYILNSKDCTSVFRAEQCEKVLYSDYVIRLKDSMHASVCANGEQLYETATVNSHSRNVKFSFNTRTSEDSEYLVNCRNCTNCFGCAGLRDKSFCILNKQYSPDDYWSLLDEIKVNMLQRGEYGEFFPISLSPFPYNGSLASIVFPKSQEEIIAAGGFWYDAPPPDTANLAILRSSDLPDDIKDISGDILEKAIIDNGHKAYRIIPDELNFCKKMDIPLPLSHPYARIRDRFGILNNLKTIAAICEACGKKIESAADPTFGFKPYCEECYQNKIV